MTDLAVVVTHTVTLRTLNTARSRVGECAQTNSVRYIGLQSRNHVLVLVMRKLNQKLARRLRIAKSKTHIVPRRDLRMTNRADDGFRASEKLRPVTTDTRVVSRIIGNVGKLSHLFPVLSGNLVAGVAGSLMF